MTAPAMARCSVCNDPRLAFIDASVASGQSLKQVAAATGVSYPALRRHVANHVVTTPPPTPATNALPAGASPYDVMRARVDDLAAMDTTAMSSRDRISHSEELRRAAETLAKLAPVDPTTAAVRVADVKGLPELMGELIDIVDRHGPHRRVVTRGDNESDEAFRGRAIGVASEHARITTAINAAMRTLTERMAAEAVEEGT